MFTYKTVNGAKMCVTRPLSSMPHAQAGVLVQNGVTTLYSYETAVARIDFDGWLEVTGLYSATTRRHISVFAREMGLDYQTCKTCAQTGMKFNIYTAEFCR